MRTPAPSMPWLGFIVFFALVGSSGCTGQGAGTFSVHFSWRDGPPDPAGRSLQIRARLVQVPETDAFDTSALAGASTLAESGPMDLQAGGQLDFGDLTYGPNRAIIAEVTDGAAPGDEVLFWGASDLFALRPDRSVAPQVAVALQPAPGYDSDGRAIDLQVAFLVDGQAASRVASHQVDLAFGAPEAEWVELANDPAFSQGWQRFFLPDLVALGDGRYSPGLAWDLDAGLPDALVEERNRSVFVRLGNALGYRSPVTKAPVIYDPDAPVAISASLTREPVYLPALQEVGRTLFSPLDPRTRGPVVAKVFVTADEPFSGASLTARLPGTTEELVFLTQMTAADTATFRYEFAGNELAGEYTLYLRWQDDLHNQAEVALAPILDLDPSLPDIQAALDQERLIYLRAPWGTHDSGGAPFYRLAAEANTISQPAGGSPIVGVQAYRNYSDQTSGNLVGETYVRLDGGFDLDPLTGGDLPAVYLVLVSQHGAISDPVPVTRVEWRGSLAHRMPYVPASNPLRLRTLDTFVGSLDQLPNLAEEPADVAAASVRDGTSVERDGGMHWRELANQVSGPSGRYQHDLAWDPVRGGAWLYGGNAWTGDLVDLWFFDGTTHKWTRLDPGGDQPTPVHGHQLAFEPGRDRLYLFGGFPPGSGFYEYQPSQDRWTKRPLDQSGPGPRVAPALEADPARGSLILVGGAGSPEDDLWEWTDDGSPTGQWTDLGAQLDPAADRPSTLGEPTLTYDSLRGRMMLYQDGALWALDPSIPAWTRQTETGDLPPEMAHPRLAYLPTSDTVILQGGICLDPQLCTDHAGHGDGLWEWDPTLGMWTQVFFDNFSADPEDAFRGEPALLVDPLAGEVYVHGGWDCTPACLEKFPTDALLRWSPAANAFVDLAATIPLPEDRRYAQVAGTADGLLMFGGMFSNGMTALSYQDSWLWHTPTGRWMDVTPTSGPAPEGRYGHALATGGDGRVILFGGCSGYPIACTPVADTWIWDPTDRTWQQPALGTAPPGRMDHSLAFDGQGALVFGGCSGSVQWDCQLTGETWRLGANDAWELVADEGQSPPAREGQAMCQAGADAVYLFGGSDGGDQPLADLWRWDAQAAVWSQIPQQDPWPAGRRNHSLIWDDRAERLLLIAGQGEGNVQLSDIWAYRPDTGVWRQLSVSGVKPPVSASFSMAWFDDRNRLLSFVDGPGEAVDSEIWELQDGQPGQILDLPLSALLLPATARMESLSIEVTAGGTARASASAQDEPGAQLLAWRHGRWDPQDAHQATPDAPGELSALFDGSADLAALFGGDDPTLFLALLPAAAGPVETRVALDYLELRLRYRVQE